MALTPVSFIEIPENPVPAGGACYMLDTPDGAKLRVATFPAPYRERARANVVLLTGRSEFIEKYFEIVSDLQQRGFSVTTLDWRGQGLSSRLLPINEKGHITTFETFTADLRLVVEQVTDEFFPGPRILMTHSMGSVPALQSLAKRESDFLCAIMCAPMTRLFATPAKRLFIHALTRTAVTVGASRQCVPGIKEHSLDFEGNVLTSDRNRHARFRALQAAAPNATIGAPTYGWLNAALDAIKSIHNAAYMRELNTPVLIISAENDQVVDRYDHVRLANQNTNIHCVILKGALHEIMMEQDIYRNEYWRAFDDFVEPILSEAIAEQSQSDGDEITSAPEAAPVPDQPL